MNKRKVNGVEFRAGLVYSSNTEFLSVVNDAILAKIAEKIREESPETEVSYISSVRQDNFTIWDFETNIPEKESGHKMRFSSFGKFIEKVPYNDGSFAYASCYEKQPGH